MFDQLDNVKTAWSENRVVMLRTSISASSSKEKITIVVPTPIMTSNMLKQMRELGNSQICVVASYDLCKTLELPFLRTVYRAVSSRYPIIDYFLKQDQTNSEISKSAPSLAIDGIDVEFGNTDKDILKTILRVGNLIDGFHHHELKQKEFVGQFRNSFKIPGNVPLIRSSLHLLKSKVSTYELSIALCEIAKYPMTATICDLIDSKTGTYLTIEKAEALSTKYNIPLIEMKTVIDLWRSILKVPKNQIADY